jgi:hypothetical protein
MDLNRQDTISLPSSATDFKIGDLSQAVLILAYSLVQTVLS